MQNFLSRLSPVSLAACLAAALAHLPAPTRGDDYFLTLGGGYDPSGNQASLERNVLFQQRVLREQSPDASREIYFADGEAPERDLQVLDLDREKNCPPAQRLMTEIFGAADSVGLCYRNPEIDGLSGPSELALLKRRFRELGTKLKPGDRLIVYATGHGSGSFEGYEYDYEKEEWIEPDPEEVDESADAAFDTSLHLWNLESVDASEFARWLDRLHPEVTVVLVMVQCYSGGFSHVIFHQNDAALGLSPRPRCGFFAQVHDRPAAGCTPDALQADFMEYSTCFWTALGGKKPSGKRIDRPDFDGDGNVSFAEAHAYTVIESTTIDIPVRTSEELLRRYSRLGETPAAGEDRESGVGLFLKMLSMPKAPATEFVEAKGPLADLLAAAKPEVKAILDRLPKKLDLPASATVEQVRSALEKAERDDARAAKELGSAGKSYESALTELQDAVKAEWPELGETFTPMAAELTGPRSDEFVEFVEALPSYEAYRTAAERQESLTDEYMEIKNREAGLQRLIRIIETTVLAANLPKAASAEIVARYAQLVVLEEQGLSEAPR